MEFLDKRVKVIAEELKKLAIRARMPIDRWEMKKGTFYTPEEARAAQTPFEPFDSRSMHWYGPDAHYWFSAQVKVPEAFDGGQLWLRVHTQIDEWDDGKNPQFLLFVDGEPVQGIDMNHREVLLDAKASAGDVLLLDLQAYTGTLHSEFRLVGEMVRIDPEVLGLHYDLQVPLLAFPRLDAQSRARIDIERTLNAAVNLIDLRTPYDAAFAESVGRARRYLADRLYGHAEHAEVIASCIGHTHIDVAWWWTVEQTREKVARSFATVLKLMEEYPGYRFMSSQPQLYAFLQARYPDLFARVKARIEEGRWEAEGGMWIEADCNLTSGESLVRQFLYGKRYFKDTFGVDNRILWLPDVFGYSGALPQIMRKCGIDYFMTTKLSWNQFDKIPNDTFLWEGIDGSSVLTHLITTVGVGQPEANYFTTYNGLLHPDALIGGWKRYQNKDINNDILVAYGFGDGGGGPTREMLETSKRLERGVSGLPLVRQVFARKYFDELAARVMENPRLNRWVGELYFEYHRGTYTSMARNKRSNRKAEFAMMDLELLSVLAGDSLPWPGDRLQALWRVILLNQFHDILPGTAIREVYDVTRTEYAALMDEALSMQQARMAALCPPGDNVAVFNTKGFTSDEVIRLPDGLCPAALADEGGAVYPVQQTKDGAIAYVRGLPSKGFKVFTLTDGAPQTQTPFRLEGNVLSTPYYEVAFDEAGLIGSLFDRENQRQVLQAGHPGNLLRVYEDKPIYYDNWDIDIFYTEKFWDVTALTRMEWQEMGPVRATLEIERPYSHSRITQRIHFYADSRRIDFHTFVDWQEHQQLLKVHFPVAVHTDEATFDIQFGNLTRKTHANTSWDRARFESCGHKWMDVSEGHYGVSLLNDCKYGHSARGGSIALTLIKSGIEPNPTADQERHEFTYALLPHAGGWRDGGTVQEAYRLNQPALVSRGGLVGSKASLADVDRPNVIIETIKRAEDGDGTIVRLYETDSAQTQVLLRWGRQIAEVISCNLIEEDGERIPFDGQQISLTMQPYEIKTLRIRGGV